MNDKLFKMIIRIAKIIGKAEERIQNRKVLPKPKLMIWTGEILEYASFRKQMGELLDYGNPDLELEILKQQIKGPKASAALKCLFNVRNKEHAIEILDRKYGDIEMVMPQLKSDLATQKSMPTSMAEESINIQEILNVYKTLQKHGRTELIDLSFIQ